MSIDTINYLLSKYYDGLTTRQFLYQNEIENPSICPVDEIEPKIEYEIEIKLFKHLIEELENLRDGLVKFEV